MGGAKRPEADQPWGRRALSDNYIAKDDKYETKIQGTPAELDVALPSVVSKIVTPLLRRFAVFEPTAHFFEQKIGKMLRREYG
jgi:hypothetical protein